MLDALFCIYVKLQKTYLNVTKLIIFSLYWNHACHFLFGLKIEKATGICDRGSCSLSKIKESKTQAQAWVRRQDKVIWEGNLRSPKLPCVSTLPNFSLPGENLNPTEFTHTLMFMLSTSHSNSDACVLTWHRTRNQTAAPCEGSNWHPKFQPGPASVQMPQRLEPS